nr:hypothetical protein [Tanacetum cinerariifolium]
MNLSTTHLRPKRECKGDVKFIEVDETKPIPTVPNPKPINSNSPTISPFLRISPCISHTRMRRRLPNYVGDKKLKSINDVGTGRIRKKEKYEKGMPKEHNKEWKLNEKAHVMEEDAWRRIRLISHAYANFCVAFIIWSLIANSFLEEFCFS